MRNNRYMFANEAGHLSPSFGSLIEAECEAVGHIKQYGGKRIILYFTDDNVWEPVALARITEIANDTPIVYTRVFLASCADALADAAMLATDRAYDDTLLGEETTP